MARPSRCSPLVVVLKRLVSDEAEPRIRLLNSIAVVLLMMSRYWFDLVCIMCGSRDLTVPSLNILGWMLAVSVLSAIAVVWGVR